MKSGVALHVALLLRKRSVRRKGDLTLTVRFAGAVMVRYGLIRSCAIRYGKAVMVMLGMLRPGTVGNGTAVRVRWPQVS